jgi:tetratricopeptide (TPR) repeat protein
VFGRPIGVASDVYSLGVVLYRLLTGLPPYTFGEGNAGMVRALSTDTVVAPSRAMMGKTLAGPAVRKRARQIAGDLDTIVATALKKATGQRYATVDAFADDIRRHLAHEPIHARPDSLGYRARKFLRRNAVAVAAACVASLALVVGFAVAVWQAHVAQVERARAEQRFEDVRTLAHAVLYKLDDALVQVPGTTPARKELVSEMLDYLRRLSAEEQTSLPMRMELAAAWMRVGDVQGGNSANIGNLQGALASYAQALRIADVAVEAAPDDLKARRLRANVLTHLGEAQYQANALADAERTDRKALAEWTALAKREPGDLPLVAREQDALGNVVFWTGKIDAAVDAYHQAIATLQRAGPGNDAHDYTILMGEFQQDAGYAEVSRNHVPEARALLLQSIATVQPLLQANPGDVPATMLVSDSWVRLGDALSRLPDPQPMVDAYTHFHDIAAQSVARDPANTIARHQLAMADMKVGDAQAVAGHYDLALASLKQARDANLAIVAHDPADQNTRANLADCWEEIGRVEHEVGDSAAAVAAYREALAIRQSLVDQSPQSAELRRILAKVEGGFADVQPDAAEACRLRKSADAIWQQLARAGTARPMDKDRIEKARQQAAACR